MLTRKNSLEDTVTALRIGQQRRLGNGLWELLIMESSLANQGGVDYKNPYECSASCHSENWQHGEAQKSYPACSLTTLQIFTTSLILVREKV